MVKENVLMSISVHNEYTYTCMLYTLIHKHRDTYTHRIVFTLIYAYTHAESYSHSYTHAHTQ